MKPKWSEPVNAIFDLFGNPFILIAMALMALWVVFGSGL